MGDSPGELREVQRGLERLFPSWRIWYVRQLHGEALWFAQQGVQLIDAESPEDLTTFLRSIEESRIARQGGPA